IDELIGKLLAEKVDAFDQGSGSKSLAMTCAREPGSFQASGIYGNYWRAIATTNWDSFASGGLSAFKVPSASTFSWSDVSAFKVLNRAFRGSELPTFRSGSGRTQLGSAHRQQTHAERNAATRQEHDATD